MEQPVEFLSNAELETIVIGNLALAERKGAAKAELTRRQVDRENALDEAVARREVLRKQFEDALEGKRQAHAELLMKEQKEHAEQLMSTQHLHAEKMMKIQQEHAEELARLQLEPARSSATATKLAAWAAGFSALGTIIAAVLAVLSYFDH